MIKKWLSKIEWQLVGVLGVVAVVVWMNFPVSSYLSGWDNLHPEFDFSLNFWRALSGVWVENEGVGATLGHGFSASLPHTMFLWLMSLVVPVMHLRGGFVLWMYVVGVMGVYSLVRKMFGRHEFARWGAMIGALFYALNLGTVQTFFAPLEAFVIMYGLLPWVVLTIGEYLHEPTKKKLITLLIVQILFSSIGFIPPLFVAYGFVLAGMLLGYLWKGKNGFGDKLKRVMLVGVMVVVANLYWVMPVVRYSVAGSQAYVEAKNNRLSTSDFQYMSEARGKIKDTVILRGFFIDSADLVIEGEGVFYQIFESWSDHLADVEWIGYVMFVLVVLGLVGMWRVSVDEYWYGGVIVSFVAGFVILTQGEDVFAKIIELLKDVPMLGQAFRAAWTKFSGILILAYAVLIPFGVWLIVEQMRKLRYLLIVLVMGGMMIFGWPILQGKLIYSRLKIDMPNEYFEIFEFMKTQDVSSRIANLPMAWNWGWGADSWGYSGSGFLWYGIEQPILDRAFDVWSPYNESFYNELSTVMYGEDVKGVGRVLAKYDVSYVLLDESVIAPGQGEEILRIPETKKIARELGWEEKFREGSLTVWETMHGKYDQFVSAPASYVLAEGETIKTRRDVIYEKYGDYVEEKGGISYPFANLMREVVDVEYGDNGIQLMANGIWQGGELVMPGFQAGGKVELGYKLQIIDNKLQIEWEPVYSVNGEDGPKLLSDQFAVISDQVGEKQYLWVQIGDNEAVFVEEGKTVAGSARLVVGEEIEIKIYDGVVNSDQSAVISLQGEQRCGENNMYRCYAIPLEKPSEESLLQVVTVYEGGVSPEICLDLEGEPYQCANERKLGVSPMINMLAVDEDERYWLDYVLRDEGTVLKAPIVRWYELLESRIMNHELWEGWGNEQRYSLRGDSLKVEVVGVPKSYDFASIGKSEALNCDVLERGVVSKESGRYAADEYGSNCDHVLMSELDVEMSYLMRMQGENVAGRSVKLFLHNTGSERNDLEYLLDEEEFDQTFSLLSWDYPGSYSLNVETRSFGQYSENILEPVEVRWMPLEQITGAKIVNSEQRIINDVRVGEVKKTGTWLYRVEVSGEGLLSLSQGYDEGWVAWSDGWLEHVKVSGWKNGWVVEDGASEVVIFYWPQLLQYLGFLMLGVSVVWVWIAKK